MFWKGKKALAKFTYFMIIIKCVCVCVCVFVFATDKNAINLYKDKADHKIIL